VAIADQHLPTLRCTNLGSKPDPLTGIKPPELPETLDPEQLAPQMGVSTASVLTLIAFQFSLGYLLPRVSYLTRADRFVLGASTLVFLALAEAILSSRLAAAGRIELALRMDRHSRWIYPVLFLAMALRTLRF